ncbi:hypothetical protein F4678DRAFT_421046 [Xylaria arbuscula]|nr:hypothetical protein F4678DRAFT_421046 [Xylaria arbuscula]
MNIPGYYYDAEKRRYFKVENSNTAPKDAAWSSDSVKRRKLRDEDAATALRHLNIAKARIKRAQVLREPLMGGFFAREYGAAEDDMQAACFAQGLRHKGCISFLPNSYDNPTEVKHMFISGRDDKTGLCNVYATYTGGFFHSTYFLRDKKGHLNQRLLPNYRIPGYYPHNHWSVIPQISDIQYHAPSNCVFVTSRQPLDQGNPNSLWTFSPTTVEDDTDPLRPRWLHTFATETSSSTGGPTDGAHCVAPAPAFSSAVCAVGTTRGIIQLDRELTPSALSRAGPLFNDVFAIDFHPNHGDVFRFGGRLGALFTADRRVPVSIWSHLQLPSTITHLKCLGNGNQVLVAGLQNQLGVYDLRFARKGIDGSGGSVDIDHGDEGVSNNGRNYAHNSRRQNFNTQNRNGNKRRRHYQITDKSPSVTQPVVKFEHYRNAAHIDIGFAYDAGTGVVAAAHDDVPGTVVLYSVRTGSRLRVLGRDFAEYGWAKTKGSQQMISHNTVIQALQFQPFPGDLTPTLFIGAGGRSTINALAFGVDKLDDEA